MKQPVAISVTGRNLPITDPLRRYVETKMVRLARYLDRLARIEVVLAAEHTREVSARNMVEATATVKGKTLRAEASEGDMYAAIDAVVDKLHMQLTRVKERSRAHRGLGLADAELSSDSGDAADIHEEGEDGQDIGSESARIVEVKQLALKPMFADEAVDELEDMGRTFYVFLNAKTEKVSVVYRRHGGDYGLIEPAFE